jgi:NADH:ubiquinone reductase (H+-translocating)
VVGVTATRVLIVGGGFAGTYAAMEMTSLAREGNRVTLVSTENFLQYQPFLPEVASGTIDPRAAVVPLRPLLRHAAVVVGEVTSIDHHERRAEVRIPDGRTVTVDYDVVVLAAGSWSRVLPIPGLAEQGIGFKTIQEAIYLRNHVLSRLDVAAETDDAEARGAALTFVVVGGGYAGVEALGELEDLTRDAIRHYPGLAPTEMRWILVEAAARILPELDPDLAAYASRRLQERGIEILVETRLESAEGGVLRLSDGQVMVAGTLVWTAGVKASPLAGLSGFPLDERGRVRVDEYLRVEGVSGAWAAGDIAAVPDRTTGGFAPPTAQHAMREGRRLGANVTASLGGGELRPFVWRNVGSVCSLGRYKGVAQVAGVKVKGFLGWFLHRSYHLWAMPTFARRVRIAADWTIALLFPRDTAQLGSFERPRDPFRRAAGS